VADYSNTLRRCKCHRIWHVYFDSSMGSTSDFQYF